MVSFTAFTNKKREASIASRTLKPEAGKHNRKAGRKKRMGPGGGERRPCPVQKQTKLSSKKQARMQQIAERLESIGALPELEPAPNNEAGAISGKKKRKQEAKKRKREAAAAAQNALHATVAA